MCLPTWEQHRDNCTLPLTQLGSQLVFPPVAVGSAPFPFPFHPLIGEFTWVYQLPPLFVSSFFLIFFWLADNNHSNSLSSKGPIGNGHLLPVYARNCDQFCVVYLCLLNALLNALPRVVYVCVYTYVCVYIHTHRHTHIICLNFHFKLSYVRFPFFSFFCVQFCKFK